MHCTRTGINVCSLNLDRCCFLQSDSSWNHSRTQGHYLHTTHGAGRRYDREAQGGAHTRTRRWNVSLPAFLVMYLLAAMRAASSASLLTCSFSQLRPDAQKLHLSASVR